jgi:hypothetical protein
VTRQTGSSARTGRDFAARFSALSTREKWGYGFWLFLGLVFGIPESWAGLANPPWPALSDTVGHLDQVWPPTAVIVVALIVFVAYYFVRVPVSQAGALIFGSGGPGRGAGADVGRTYNGRLSRAPADASPVPALVYVPLALAAITIGSIIAAVTSGFWVLGYAIYGLIAVFLVIIPNVLAYWFAREVPWPTLLTTITDLEHRWRPVAVVVLAGLVILMFHLAFFPWPDHLG